MYMYMYIVILNLRTACCFVVCELLSAAQTDRVIFIVCILPEKEAVYYMHLRTQLLLIVQSTWLITTADNYNGNSRITTEFPFPEQSSIQL